DQQGRMAQDAQPSSELAGRLGLLERLDEADQRAVVTATSALSCGDREADCQVCLPDARWSEEDHVLPALDEAELVQALDLLAANRGLEGEVELIQRLDRRQPRRAHRGLQPSVVTQGDLSGEEPFDRFGRGERS